MPIKTEVTCWQLTGNNSNKRNKPKETPSTSFQVQWEKVVSSRFKEQAEKKAKEFVTLALPPPNAFTKEQLHDLEFGDMSLYDIIASIVVSLWKYYFKQGQTIDYEILKTSAESPITQQYIYGFFFEKSQGTIFSKIEAAKENKDQEERPDLFIKFINSDQFTLGMPAFSAEYISTVTATLYGKYYIIALIIADGFLAAQPDWFYSRGSLKLTDTARDRVIESIKALQKDPTYQFLTLDKAVLHLHGKMPLEKALAPDPAKGGTRKRKCTQRKCTQRKLRKNKRKRNRTHKRLSATAKSRIMRGK